MADTPFPLSLSRSRDYRAVLKAELRRRRERNPRYSQGAFARDLGLAGSRLSEVLRRKQGLSPASAGRVASRLGWTGPERRFFCELVRATDARSRLERGEAKARLAKLRQTIRYAELKEDATRLVAEWYHLPVLELFKTSDLKPTPAHIARRLGVAEAQAKDALDRLERLGLLKRTAEGFCLPRPDNYGATEVPKEVVRRFHATLIDRAKEALESQPPELREFTTLVLALDRETLPAVKEQIAELWRTLDRDQRLRPHRTDVYCLGVQLFNLTPDRAEDASA